jgi:hypothetical protein
VSAKAHHGARDLPNTPRDGVTSVGRCSAVQCSGHGLAWPGSDSHKHLQGPQHVVSPPPGSQRQQPSLVSYVITNIRISCTRGSRPGLSTPFHQRPWKTWPRAHPLAHYRSQLSRTAHKSALPGEYRISPLPACSDNLLRPQPVIVCLVRLGAASSA